MVYKRKEAVSHPKRERSDTLTQKMDVKKTAIKSNEDSKDKEKQASAKVQVNERVSSQEDFDSENDLSEASDDDEDVQTDGSEDDDTDFPLKKKSKKSKHDDGSNEFSSAINAILSSHLKAYDRNDPIMARNKKVLKQNESDKLEKKAKRALLVEKKKRLEKARKKDIIPQVTDDMQSGDEIRQLLEKETRLRKIARKGAVKLFNAILSTQVKTERDAKTKYGDIRNTQEKEQLITEVSKEKFLDMVKAAGEEN